MIDVQSCSVARLVCEKFFNPLQTFSWSLLPELDGCLRSAPLRIRRALRRDEKGKVSHAQCLQREARATDPMRRPGWKTLRTQMARS